MLIDPAGGSGNNVLVPVAAVGLLLGVAGSFLVGRLLTAYYRRRDLSDHDLLAQAYFQTTLVRAAVLEATAFLCLIAVMTSGNRLGFAGAGLCVVLMAALFPTRESWARFHATVTDGDESDRFEPR